MDEEHFESHLNLMNPTELRKTCRILFKANQAHKKEIEYLNQDLKDIRRAYNKLLEARAAVNK